MSEELKKRCYIARRCPWMITACSFQCILACFCLLLIGPLETFVFLQYPLIFLSCVWAGSVATNTNVFRVDLEKDELSKRCRVSWTNGNLWTSWESRKLPVTQVQFRSASQDCEKERWRSPVGPPSAWRDCSTVCLDLLVLKFSRYSVHLGQCFRHFVQLKELHFTSTTGFSAVLDYKGSLPFSSSLTQTDLTLHTSGWISSELKSQNESSAILKHEQRILGHTHAKPASAPTSPKHNSLFSSPPPSQIILLHLTAFAATVVCSYSKQCSRACCMGGF